MSQAFSERLAMRLKPRHTYSHSLLSPSFVYPMFQKDPLSHSFFDDEPDLVSHFPKREKHKRRMRNLIVKNLANTTLPR